MKCTLKKKDGKQCGAHALQNDKYCFNHSEKTRSDKRDAVVKGGKARAVPKTVDKAPVTIESELDIMSVLVEALNEARTLPVSTQKINTIGYTSNIILNVLQHSRIYERDKLPEEDDPERVELVKRAFDTLLLPSQIKRFSKPIV